METKIRLSSGLQAPCFETVIVALLLVFSKHTDFLIYSIFPAVKICLVFTLPFVIYVHAIVF